jgi:hypothetical protein
MKEAAGAPGPGGFDRRKRRERTYLRRIIFRERVSLPARRR